MKFVKVKLPGTMEEKRANMVRLIMSRIDRDYSPETELYQKTRKIIEKLDLQEMISLGQMIWTSTERAKK